MPQLALSQSPCLEQAHKPRPADPDTSSLGQHDSLPNDLGQINLFHARGRDLYTKAPPCTECTGVFLLSRNLLLPPSTPTQSTPVLADGNSSMPASSPAPVTNEVGNTTLSGQTPSGDLTGKHHLSGKAPPNSAGADLRGYRYRNSSSSSFRNASEAVSLGPESEPMSILLPLNVPKSAVIGANCARHKPANATRQSTKGSHQSPNEPNINVWTKWNSRH